MQVKLNINIGTRDCKKLKIDFEKAVDGATIDVSDEAAARIVKCGWGSKPEKKGDK